MDPAHILQNLFGAFVPRDDHNAMDDDEMPALEPIVSVQPTTTTPAAQAPETSLDDVHMQPAQSTSAVRNDNDDDDDSMPDLQSVSNSSDSEDDDDDDDDDDESDRDANEVEMQAVQDDDNDSSWTDEDEDMPTLEPINGTSTPAATRRTNRRARVEDDQDDERDRRHPSQRVADTMSINEPPPSTAPSTGTATPLPLPPLNPQNQFGPPPMPNQFTPRPLPPIPPHHMLFRIPLGRFQPTNQNAQNNNNNDNNNNANPNPNLNAGMFGGFAITIDNNGMPVLHAHHHHGLPNDNGNGNPNPNGGPGQPQVPPVGTFGGNVLPQDLSALFNFFGNAVGMGFGFGEREQEDPERAKRLVDGLEEVPVGLVRRLGRVGGGGLEGEEGVGASGGDGGCAICWDSLLDGDLNGEGWAKKEKEKEEGAAAEGENVSETAAAATETGASSMEAPTSADTIVEASPSSTKDVESGTEAEPKSNSSEPEQPKIVSLPCAHVFHAACLIPWFSRPRQTTCPTCRFNIDPENLTYVRRRAPANNAGNGNAAAAQAQGEAQAQAQAQGGEQPQPQGAQQPVAPGPVPTVPMQNAVPSAPGDTVFDPAPAAGANANALNGFHQFFLNVDNIDQASRDILAGTRADLAAALASAQAARDNPPVPGDPTANTRADPRLGDMVASAAALRRAEEGLVRVEQWLERVGMAGGVLARMADVQGVGAAGGNVGTSAGNGNVGAPVPAAAGNANVNADAAENNDVADGENFILRVEDVDPDGCFGF
jgi:Ring finger domain